MKEVEASIKQIEKIDPDRAHQLRDFIQNGTPELNEAFSREIGDDEIQYYPGSINGPMPEDDPDAYSQWYIEHQPKGAFKDGVVNVEELGVKTKYLRSKDDQSNAQKGAQKMVYQSPVIDVFTNRDPADPFEQHDFIPEFAMFDKANFQTQEGIRNPELTFQSNTGPNELPPMQPDCPMDYEKVHFDLEKWSVYRLLPQLLKWDRAMMDFVTNVDKGMIVIPDYHKERNQPSLWTYYNTLPEWCRENNFVRQTLFAFEYNKPHLNMQEKELALNFAASLLRPIEGRFRDVITQVAMSNKERINVQTGKVMMNELNFYTIDVADLGSDTEDDGDDEA